VAGTGDSAFGGTPTDTIDVLGEHGTVRVNDILTMGLGALHASKEIGYGTLVPFGTLVCDAGPSMIHAVPPWPAPATTAQDAWAVSSSGDKYELTPFGEVKKNGVSQGVFLPPFNWSGWTFAASWTHAAGSEFVPGGTPATIYSTLPLVVQGGPEAPPGVPAPRKVTLISATSVTIETAPVSLEPATRGLSIFADLDVLITSPSTFGTAAEPGYVVSGEQVLLNGTGSGVTVHGSVIAKNGGTVSTLVSANKIEGKVLVVQDALPAFVLGKPRIVTLVAFESLADPSLPLPVDASEGSLGVYR
jgi:hypothetical protein